MTSSREASELGAPLFAVSAFSRPALIDAIVAASGGDVATADLYQVRYLASYLSKADLRPTVLVVERDYVDRHYLEEYTGYYATTLRPPTARTTRIHLFSAPLNDFDVEQWVAVAAHCREGLREAAQQCYLGFIGVRPIPDAPIGRTLLRAYADKPATTRHTVHLAGVDLQVAALPFQQQERAVGACATTAIWSALARVMRADGHRAPTPWAVTAAATRHTVTGRALPANAGLDLGQMLAAIQHFGYSPHVLKLEDGKPGDFLLAIKAYVRSGIPVVLRVHPPNDDAHAVTVAGFRECDAEEPVEDIRMPLGERELRSRGLSRVFLHDDRLGPYARAKWIVKGDQSTAKLYVRLEPGEPGYERFCCDASVWQAIVPLYPKLRLSAEDLIAFAAELEPLMRAAARTAPRLEPRFSLSGTYLGTLYDRGIERERLHAVMQQVRLSRYVGVIEYYAGDTWVGDIVVDSTDIRREIPQRAPVLLVVLADASHTPTARAYVPGAIVA
jgi:hypothetical protein